MSWFGIQWVMLGTVKEVLFSWSFRRRRHRAWEVAPLALMWIIWEGKIEELLMECKKILSI